MTNKNYKTNKLSTKITLSAVASVLLTTSLFSQELSTITVTSATKSEQSIKDVTSNVEVITKEEIEERHFTTVTEALNTISGISFTRNGGIGSSSSVKLRGFDNKRVLVLIDGIRYNDVTSSSGAPFAHLMINNVEKIEVIKGAQSGIWGADASAGVINIITKNAKEDFNGSINLEYGSYNTKKYGLNLSYKKENFSIQGSLSKIDSDSLSAQTPNGDDVDDFEDDSYENLTSNLKFKYNFDDNNQIELSHMMINADLDYDGCENKTWVPPYATWSGYYSCTDTKNDEANATSYHSKTKDSFSSINYNFKTENFSTTFFTNKSTFDRTYTNSNYYTGGAADGTSDETEYEYDGDINEYGIKSEFKYLKDSLLISGVDYKNFEHKNEISNKYNNKGFSLTNINRFNDNNTILTESLRYDRYSKFDNKTTGKIGIKHYFNSDFSISSNYGTGYNVPSLYSLYSNYGSEDLNPETTKSFDIGIQYKDFNLTYFDNRITDMIDYDSSVYKFNNLDGETNIKGIELTYKKEVYLDTLLSLNYTYLDAKDSSGEDLQRRAKNNLKVGVDYYGIKDFHFNLNAEYVGDRVEYSYGTYDIDARTGKYTIWNSVINYQINKDLSTYLKLDNIFNKYYQTVDGYATAERSVYLGLTYKF